MKTAVCYYSRHHGNTLKVLEAMAHGVPTIATPVGGVIHFTGLAAGTYQLVETAARPASLYDKDYKNSFYTVRMDLFSDLNLSRGILENSDRYLYQNRTDGKTCMEWIRDAVRGQITSCGLSLLGVK